MGDPVAISAENLSKKYRLFDSPKERLWEALHPFKKNYHREFWALKDISFQIPKGATVGIIGQNGSGKSTLLKIICSVLKPTIGEIAVNGRVSALLELGSGFHPEFTGRENVQFSGTLSGFSRDEMKERLPQIEAFADIGEFIDQPVRIYSSGMLARLAFSTAIHIDPEILVIDEILSVGDAKFQNKCFQKFREFQEAGKTVLFVSHNTDQIVRHCDSAFLLSKGHIIEIGKPKDIVNCYISMLEGKILTKPKEDNKSEDITADSPSFTSIENNSSELHNFIHSTSTQDNCSSRKSYNKHEKRQRNNQAEIIDYLVICNDKSDPSSIQSGDRTDFYIKVLFHEPVKFPLMGLAISTYDGVLIYGFNSFFTQENIPEAQKGDIVIGRISLNLKLGRGDYFFDLGVDLKESENSIKYTNLDRRCAIIHLNIIERNRFFGLADFEAVFKHFP